MPNTYRRALNRHYGTSDLLNENKKTMLRGILFENRPRIKIEVEKEELTLVPSRTSEENKLQFEPYLLSSSYRLAFCSKGHSHYINIMQLD